MRQGELLKLTWKDVDLDRKTAALMDTKNGESRSVPLTDKAAAALKELKEAKVVELSVFLNLDGTPLQRRWLSRRWERILTAAEVTDFHWHDLRHTCASILAQNGATLQEVQVLLGHKSMRMTEKYAHLVQGRVVTGHDKLDEMLNGKS
jgi:integrase